MIRWAQRAPKRYRVMQLIADGLTMAEVAERTGSCKNTVRKQIEVVRRKIGVRNNKISSAVAFSIALDGGDANSVRIYLSKAQLQVLTKMMLMLLRGADVTVAVRNKEFVQVARKIIDTWSKTRDTERIE